MVRFCLILLVLLTIPQVSLASRCKTLNAVDEASCNGFEALTFKIKKSSLYHEWRISALSDGTDLSVSEWPNQVLADFYSEELALAGKQTSIAGIAEFVKRASKNSLHPPEAWVTQVAKSIYENMNGSTPIEGALSIFQFSVEGLGNTETSKRVARGLADTVLRYFGFPNLPLNVSTRSTPAEIRKEFQTLLDHSQKCSPGKNECTSFYSFTHGPRTQSSLFNLYSRSLQTVLLDLIRTGAPFGAKGREVVYRLIENFGFRESIQTQWSEQDRIALFELLSDPLNEDLRTWTWVTGRLPSLSRTTIYCNPYLFRTFVLGENSKVGALQRCGAGLYVSRNPFDSAQFGISKEEIMEMNEKAQGNPTEHGVLLLVTVKKGAKVLDYPDSFDSLDVQKGLLNNRSIFIQLGISQEDPYILNPNIVIDYRPGVSEWMVIKLRPQNNSDTSIWYFFSSLVVSAEVPFSVKEVTATDFTKTEIAQIKQRIDTNKFFIAMDFFKQIFNEWMRRN